MTPLILAASGGHHEIVRLLLQHGASINEMDITGKNFGIRFKLKF